MSVKRIHELVEQGWTLFEAFQQLQNEEREEDWKLKYPNLAVWSGSTSFGRSFEKSGIEEWIFQVNLRSGTLSFQSIDYLILRTIVPASTEYTIYGVADDLIKAWREKNGDVGFDYYRSGWNRDGDWDTKYPHLQAWANFGKRHCIQIQVDTITQQNYVKAWHYDKLANQEKVIFDANANGATEAETLRVLDEGIGRWRQQNEGIWGTLPTE